MYNKHDKIETDVREEELLDKLLILMGELSKYSRRNMLLYVVNLYNIISNESNITFINKYDLPRIEKIMKGMYGELDIILVSPGGKTAVAKNIMDYLRTKFDNIRTIIPTYAMSSATFMGCASNKILMAPKAFIGPMDLQIELKLESGSIYIPAHRILTDYDTKGSFLDMQNNEIINMLFEKFGFTYIYNIEDLIKDHKHTIFNFLNTYLFANETDCTEKAYRVSEHMTDHKNFKNHSQPINRDNTKKIGFLIENLEDDKKYSDLVDSILDVINELFDEFKIKKVIASPYDKIVV